MKDKKEITLTSKDLPPIWNGYKVISSDLTPENTYAVCTPVKLK